MIGLITYHSAYNFGSVLQAYATKEKIREIANEDVDVINYRMDSQRDVYKLYSFKSSKEIIKSIFKLRLHNKRRLR